MCALLHKSAISYTFLASSYELWRANTHQILYKSIENATRIADDQVLVGNLSSPLPAYSRERLVLRIADKDVASVYALIARDYAGNPSELSNVVAAKLVHVPPVVYQARSNVGMIVGICVGVIAAIAVVIVVVVVLIRRGKGSSIV